MRDLDPRDRGTWAWLHAELLRTGSLSGPDHARYVKLARRLSPAAQREAYDEWRARRLEDLAASARIVRERQDAVDAGRDLTDTQIRTLPEHLRRIEQGAPPAWRDLDQPSAPASSTSSGAPRGRSLLGGGFVWGVGAAVAGLVVAGAVRLVRWASGRDGDEAPAGSAAAHPPTPGNDAGRAAPAFSLVGAP